jgi:Kef-type K+ transport system membrane component KefB
MTPHEITLMFLALGMMLALALVLGEVARKLHQPAVLGEILAGVVLGPTVLGRLAPGWGASLFPAEGPQALALQGLTTLAVVLFLLVAGMELDLSTIWRQGRTAITVGLAGIVVPFGMGFAAACRSPRRWGWRTGPNG